MLADPRRNIELKAGDPDPHLIQYELVDELQQPESRYRLVEIQSLARCAGLEVWESTGCRRFAMLTPT